MTLKNGKICDKMELSNLEPKYFMLKSVCFYFLIKMQTLFSTYAFEFVRFFVLRQSELCVFNALTSVSAFFICKNTRRGNGEREK